MLHVVVHPANLGDRDGAKLLLTGIIDRFPRLERIWADMGYQGPFTDWVNAATGCTVTIVRRPSKRGWVAADAEPTPPAPTTVEPLPRRWVVERTFAWLGRNRRLGKDYEGLEATGEAWIYLAMSRLMVRRLVNGM